MRTCLGLLLFPFMWQLHAQKVVKKALVQPQTTFIQIDSKYCYQVDLATTTANEVKVTANMEGEYAKDLLVSISETGATMLIGADFDPNFANPNDKLSAHKVVSIALQIHVPQYKEVSIFGTTSAVNARGNYKNLTVKLSDGTCVLENVGESVTVNTQKGDIRLMVPQGNIKAQSAYGNVEKERIPFGDNLYILNTVEGNIHLKKTK